MKTIKILALLLFVGLSAALKAQQLPANIVAALKTDNAAALGGLVNTANMDNCYTDGNWDYCLLSETIRYHAPKCFNMLISIGADVNKSCNGYVPPLMHAAKYGSLDMVKALVAKGANIGYTYDGEYQDAQGMNPITYAEKFGHKDIADYLRSVKK